MLDFTIQHFDPSLDLSTHSYSTPPWPKLYCSTASFGTVSSLSNLFLSPTFGLCRSGGPSGRSR